MTTEPTKSVFDLALETKYHLSDDSIKELAYLYMTTEKVSGRAGEIYLRTLINRAKDYATVAICPDLLALDKAEAPMYEAVKRGTLTADIQYNPLQDSAEVRSAKAKEHNRRCNWARSIKSELKSLLKTGVTLASLDADTISKSDLREQRKAEIEKLVSDGTITRPDAVAMCIVTLTKAGALIAQAKSEGLDLTTVRSTLASLTHEAA